MTVTYQILVIHADRPEWLASLRRAVASELTDLGIHNSLTVNVTEELLLAAAPAVAVALVGPSAKTDDAMTARVWSAHQNGLLIVPVVDDLRTFQLQTPEPLSKFNGFEWSGTDPERRLARTLLEQLGIEGTRATRLHQPQEI